jgi:Tfp pilus assembly protein PilF
MVISNPAIGRGPRIRRSSVWTLRNGLESEGLRWLESALVEDPRHGPTHLALADFYARAGDKVKAEQHRKMMNK